MFRNWPDRPTKANVCYTTPESVVYSVGRYTVTVEAGKPLEEAVTYMADRNQNSDPRRSLPNMEVTDGVLTIPISDFVEEVLARATPLEIAQGLFADQEVRKHVIEALARRWSANHFDDADRRKFLHDVKEAVHSRALDAVSVLLHQQEWYRAQAFFHHSHTSDVNRWLSDQGLALRMACGPEDPYFKIGDKTWNEARDDWRKLVLASFPAPVAEPEPEPEPEPEGAEIVL